MARLGVGIGLVGRRHEMSTLLAALDRAADGLPTGVLLAGDAGVGKSRLVAEVAQRAGGAGFRVLTGRCLDTDGSALPYLPFTEVVGTLAAERPELVAAHQSLRHLLPGDLRRDGVDADRELGQLRVFDAVLSVLDDVTAQEPVLVVLEDLHWADRSSRDLLVFLLARLGGQRLMVLATYRSDDLHRRHPLRALLPELVRLPAVERLELEPLGEADALELVRLLSDGTLPEPLVHGVARRSEGNAFFAEELVSACSEGLPASLVEVLLARVEGLSAPTRRLLRVAAVAGRRVRHDQLAAVAGLDVDELERALREAVHHHVLVPDPGGRDGYAFRHDLLREAIHHDLLPGERSRLHAAFAALLADPATDDEPGRAALLAHHALAAHDLPTALAASVRAAVEADEREAPAELLLHAERALELWPAVPDAEAVAGAAEYRVTHLAAWAASHTGDPERGTALARRAVRLAEQRHDPHLLAGIRLRFAMRLLDSTSGHAEARAAAEGAMPEFAAGPPSAELAWCHAVLARTHFWVDEFPESEREAHAALTAARSRPDDHHAQAAAADALVTLAGCDEYAGRSAQGRARLAEARALARRAHQASAELRTYYAVGLSLLEEVRIPEAAAELADGEARAAAAGLRWSRPGLDIRVVHVIARFLEGGWDAAEVAADLAGASVPARVSARLVAAGLLVAAARGRFDDVERRCAELLREPLHSTQAVQYLGQAGGESALWQGRPAEALRRVTAALDAVQADEPFALGGLALAALGLAAHADLAAAGPPALPGATGPGSVTATGTGGPVGPAATGGPPTDTGPPGTDAPPGSVEAARALLLRAEETARRGMPRGVELGAEGRAWLARARAELTRLTGPDPAAWDAVVDRFSYEPGDPGYRGAYARWRRAEARLALGGARGHAAEARLGTGQAETAAVAADLEAARSAAERLRAAPLLAAVTALAGRAGIRSAHADPTPSAGVLTPREHTVLTRVAEGLTNRQVGAALFISEKTVSVHLSRVMAKLGASSRTEAVSIAHRRGLLEPAGPGPAGPGGDPGGPLSRAAR